MAKERSTRKKKDSSTPAAAAVAAASGVAAELTTAPAAAGAAATAAAPAPGPYNGSENPWSRWPPRPDSYFAAGPYNTYDWAHSWPSHGDFGAFPPPPPRGGFPPHFMGAMQPMQHSSAPAAAAAPPPPLPAAAAANSPNSSNPDSQSEGSSFSDGPDDPNAENNKRKRKSSETPHKPGNKPEILKAEARNGAAAKGKNSAAAGDENSAKNKRYGIEEVKDLVRFRTDLQAKFETMSTHLELWTSIGERMSDRGHPRRQWESYRDKWDIELRRYQKELKVLQAGMVENKDNENPNPNTPEQQQQQQLIFSDELLQEIHNRLNLRPKAALRSRFQSGAGGARGCLGEENAREVAGKRMKKSANNQLLVDSIVEKVVEKVGCFDDTSIAQGFKEVLDAVVNLTGVLLADSSSSSSAAAAGAGFGGEIVIDDKVFTWLKSVGKEHFAGQFAAAQIDWNTLTMLDRDDLAEMKIPIGPRKYLLQELDKLRPTVMLAAAAAAAAAAQEQELHNLHVQPQQEPETEAV